MLVATERNHPGLLQEMERMLAEKNRVNSSGRDFRSPGLVRTWRHAPRQVLSERGGTLHVRRYRSQGVDPSPSVASISK